MTTRPPKGAARTNGSRRGDVRAQARMSRSSRYLPDIRTKRALGVPTLAPPPMRGGRPYRPRRVGDRVPTRYPFSLSPRPPTR